MTEQNPITPPPELVQEWCQQGRNCMSELNALKELATQAARWGADMELEACCKWLDFQKLAKHERMVSYLRAIRRPKPPSLKVQALKAAQRFYANGHYDCSEKEIKYDFDIIRRALNSLPD